MKVTSRKNLLATASALVLAACTYSQAQVHAADLNLTPVEIPSRDAGWGGLYLGGHAGYGWGDREGCMDVLDLNNSCSGILGGGASIIPPIPFDYDQEGALVGAQIGYNHMIRPNFLLGLEVDASFANIDGTVASLGSTGEYNWLASAKLRAGWAKEKWLLYATGGLALAGFEYDGTFGCSFEQTRDGWLGGGGVEFKISSRASLKAEYNYVDYGEESERCTVLAILPTYVETDATQQIVKFGFNYVLGRE